ncbi:MAG: glycoside hydrolase family 3 N-terminal domain-containing protein [Flavobacteriales bacterium]|nr:glycoside hydrolase family 3 N-terminal domain-containing protein [Flavobacteriales bacterium]
MSIRFICIYALLVTSIMFLFSCNNSGEMPTKDRSQIFLDSLMRTLSIEDKVGEMTQLTLGMLCDGSGPYTLDEPHTLNEEKLKKAIVDLKIGSILNSGGHAYSSSKWNALIQGIQDAATKEKTSGIPVLYGIDAIHGATYTSDADLSPQQIGLAATWNTELVRKIAESSAKDVYESGIPWNFSPVLDLGIDPRWPRFWETFGEDPLLTSDMGEAMLLGYQEGPYPIAATLKHFYGYGMPLSGKDRTPAWIPERQLREYFLPPFERAINAGAKSIMVNSGELNGIPVHINKKILHDLLRSELGFEGVLVTDWEDIKYLVSRHKVAENYRDAVKLAIDAGIDMSMVPTDLEFPGILLDLIKDGEISEARIDESVRRILHLKLELGLFENPIPTTSVITSEEPDVKNYARQAAEESITLLKNESNALPIGLDRKILVTGPTANSLLALNGGWSGTWQGDDPKYSNSERPNAAEALIQKFGQDNVINFPLEMDFDESDIDKIVSETRSQKPDYAILFLGEMPYTETPGNIEDLALFQNQKDLATALKSTGVKIIYVFIEGRPRTFNEIEPLADGILMAYLPGDYGGVALSDIISGDVNPTGRLPFTWPKNASSHIPYFRKHTEDIHTDFSLNAFNPQFNFGDGLSYCTASIDSISIDKSSYLIDDTIKLTVSISNKSECVATEVIQVYISDIVASITPSVERLRHYKKVNIEPNETLDVAMRIPIRDLGFIGIDNSYIIESGNFKIRVNSFAKTFDLIK